MIEKYDVNQTILFLAKQMGENYWFPLYNYILENPELVNSVTGFLVNHEQIIFYLGKTHLAIEYTGPEKTDKVLDSGKMEIKYFDYSLSDNNFLDQIIGFKYESTAGSFRMPLPTFSDDWILPTNAGVDKLVELKWNFSAQDSIIGFNTGGFEAIEGEFSRIVNGLFFDADENGLKTRHIKWIDFVPLTLDCSNPEYDKFEIEMGCLRQLVKHDAHYQYPLPSKQDFKFSKLPQINRFIELIGSKKNTETQITKFLEQPENKFILTMGFLGREVYPQIECEWQTEKRNNIIPDFFVEKPNGYSDIVEFKLPYTKGETIVGRHNRETFSSEINSYISQTRNYRTYFEDPNNRQWVEKNYDIKVHYPKRVLVIGRRWDFSTEEWREIINDYKDIEIITYDDLIDGVVAQFYM